MSDTRLPRTPLLNSVLTLRKEPARKEAPGGGKKEEDVVVSRLARQREALSNQITTIIDSIENQNIFSDEIFIVAEMFDDSFAISKSPKDLFRGDAGNSIIGATHGGYLVEASARNLTNLRSRIRNGQSVPIRCDVSRVKCIRPYGTDDVFRGRSTKSMWEEAAEGQRGKKFHIWLAPFQKEAARDELIERVNVLSAQGLVAPTASTILIERDPATELVFPDQSRRQNSLAVAQRKYRSKGHARAILEVPDRRSLRELVASGSVFRIEPVRQIEVTAPGSGEEPGKLPRDIGMQPVVGLLDGDCTARRYREAEAWREPSLVGAFGDGKHGNQVASIIVHGHEWNNNLKLPELYCRIGVASVVPRRGSGFDFDSDRLISYLDVVMTKHPDTKVWNVSWNEPTATDPILVSALGHDLSGLARKHRVLLVVSAGNVSSTHGDRVAPPADCEAALVVGGRGSDASGNPHQRCPESLPGYGPELQLLPHVTSFSPLRLIGGVVSKGTSYPTGLISSLAAHTFQNLRDPTPDLVRALIVEKTDLSDYDTELGWGTPCNMNMPWICPPGAVSLTFRARLKPGLLYYWQDIPIPRELIRNGKLYGSASITTVHQPLCNEEGGPNYFVSRVAAAIQYPNNKGVFVRLVGSQEKDDTAEAIARAEEYKWQPFRRDTRDFSKRGGIQFSGNSFRVYARTFARNIKQFGYGANADIPEIETVFVITFSDGRKNSGLYNAMSTSLGNYVESAVINQDIELDR